MNPLIRFLRQGTADLTDQFDIRRILLLNLFYAIASLTILAAMIQSIVAGEPAYMTYVHIGAMVLLTGVPFLARRNPNAAAVFITLIANSLVIFFGKAEGPGSATYVYYFPLFFANG